MTGPVVVRSDVHYRSPLAHARPGMTVDDLKELGATGTSCFVQQQRGNLVLSQRLSRAELRRLFGETPRYDGRRERKRDVPTTKRACMCCGRPFQSEGIHNRLCGKCRELS